MALSKKSKLALSAALEELPPDLGYLRESILAIADQDQDRLGCGEADTTLIAAALQTRRNSSVGDAEAHADILRQWLEKQKRPNAVWAGPLWFVEGFLRGHGLFATDSAIEPARMKPALGLQRTELTIPIEMKVKLWASGLELTDRSARLILYEMNAETYQIQLEQAKRPLPPDWPKPPHLRQECGNIRIGTAQAFRAINYHIESGLIVMALYWWELGATKMSAGIFSKKVRGADLKLYEPLLASIRCR